MTEITSQTLQEVGKKRRNDSDSEKMRLETNAENSQRRWMTWRFDLQQNRYNYHNTNNMTSWPTLLISYYQRQKHFFE